MTPGDPMGPGQMDPTDAGMGDQEHEIHGRAVLKAIKSGDAKAFTRALKDFVRSCEAEYGAEEMSPDEAPPY